MLLKVRVTPNSHKVQIEELGENQLRVKLLAPPIGGQANRELIETLARYYNTPKRSIQIIQGFHSRNKIIEVKD